MLDIDTKAQLLTIAKNIKRFRDDAGLTQNDLADKSGISQSYISKIEAASISITVKQLVKIATVFRCPLEDIIGTAWGLEHFAGSETPEQIFAMAKSLPKDDVEVLKRMIEFIFINQN